MKLDLSTSTNSRQLHKYYSLKVIDLLTFPFANHFANYYAVISTDEK